MFESTGPTENSVSRTVTDQIAVDARTLVEALSAELNNTQTRDQYIRLTRLVLAADRLAALAESVTELAGSTTAPGPSIS